MNLFVELYKFVKTPRIISVRKDSRILLIAIKDFIIFDIALLFFWGIMIAFLTILFDDFEMVFKSRKAHNDTFQIRLFFVGLIAPLIEELAFRLGLKISKEAVSISLAVQTILILQLADLVQQPIVTRALLMIAISIVFYFIINNKFLTFLKKHFTHFVYYNIILFGLMHATNFSFTSSSQYLFVPFHVILSPSIVSNGSNSLIL